MAVIELLPACFSSVWLIEWKALDEFVNLIDPHYEYTFLEKEKFHISVIQATFHTIQMTSQKWLDGRENITGYDIMAYTWWRFMNDSDAPPHWLVQFPMVKATVRAMDTVSDYVMKTYHKNITQFTLTGISMNAWITWLTAAVDSRVAAIIPIGMDFLNFTKSFRHQHRAYCGWSYTWRSFYEMNMTQELDNPRFSVLVSQVDPLAYNERYTNISKYVIIASGDEFSMPDNSHYYFHQLEGKKFLL
ncbi:autocrine proliferation repressor protein A-like [Eublepharis macularius]|uniref:Autocrine proliferation repressor protein A-like n=1 Tax=Eublepharis macularius TaxID=481883 RepID=A0AA97J345_EUBMA|nr:autocrine proliferation repressor protein A-like [Eublepharis macularius]